MCVVWQNRVTIYGLINWDFVLACPCLAHMFLIPNIPVCVETVLLYIHPSLLTPTISQFCSELSFELPGGDDIEKTLRTEQFFIV